MKTEAKDCIWQLKNVIYSRTFFEYKSRLYIQIMHKILYINPDL
ncbi:hypothetical protein AB1K32_25650 [Metabacillus dongyingensis]